MSLFKRGFYSVIRKPVKSGLLAAIMYVIALFLLMSVGISGGQAVAQDEIQSQVGGSLRFEQNWYWDGGDYDWGFEWVDIVEGGGGFPVSPRDREASTLNREDINKIVDIAGIANYNIISHRLMLSPANFENDQTWASRGRHDPFDDLIMAVPVLNLALLDYVAHGFISLKEGELIHPDSRYEDEFPLVISQTIAGINGLSVGDTMEFVWNDREEDKVLEHLGVSREASKNISGIVVGIFDIDRPIEAFTNPSSLENTIFTSLNFEADVLSGTRLTEIDSDYWYSLATFEIDHGGFDYEDVKEQILNLDIDWDRYNLVDSNEVFSRLSLGFAGLGRLSNFMFGVTMVAGFAMLWLIFILWVRNRHYEIAIFMAVGVEKKKIISQFIFEAFLIAVVSFVLSAVSLPLANQVIDVGELGGQFQVEDAFDLDNGFELVVGDTGETMEDVMSGDFYELATSSVAVTTESIVNVIAALSGLIVVSIAVSMIGVMRMKPREIFSKVG